MSRTIWLKYQTWNNYKIQFLTDQILMERKIEKWYLNIPNQGNCFEILNVLCESWGRREKKENNTNNNKSIETKHAPSIEEKDIAMNKITLRKHIFNLCMMAHGPLKQCGFSHVAGKVVFNIFLIIVKD